MTVSTAVGTEIIRRPGFAVTIVPGAATLPAPTRVSQAEVDATNLQLSSKPGQKGGAPSQPTDQTAARAGVGIQNAGIGPSLIPVQPQTTASGPVQIAAAVAIQQGVQNLQQTAGNSATQAATETIVIEEERNRRPPPPQPTGVKVFALVTSPDPALNSSVPFVAGTVVASGGVQVSPVFGFRNAGTEEDPTPKARTLQVAFGVNGSGASQSSNFMVATGAFATQPDGTLVYRGGFGATSRNAAAGLPSSARGTIASSGAVTVDADRVPTNATVNQNRIDRAGDVVSNTARTVIAGVPGANYGFEQSFSPATPPEALGQNRPAATLTGFMGGMVQTRSPEGNVIAAAPLIGANAVTLDPGDFARADERRRVRDPPRQQPAARRACRRDVPVRQPRCDEAGAQHLHRSRELRRARSGRHQHEPAADDRADQRRGDRSRDAADGRRQHAGDPRRAPERVPDGRVLPMRVHPVGVLVGLDAAIRIYRRRPTRHLGRRRAAGQSADPDDRHGDLCRPCRGDDPERHEPISRRRQPDEHDQLRQPARLERAGREPRRLQLHRPADGVRQRARRSF